MIRKSCYSCSNRNIDKNEFPCDKCFDMNNYRHKYSNELGLFAIGVIITIVLI